ERRLQLRIEPARRGEITTKGFLDNQPAPAATGGQTVPLKLRGDGLDQAGCRGEVEEPVTLCPVFLVDTFEQLLEPDEGLGLLEIALEVVDAVVGVVPSRLTTWFVPPELLHRVLHVLAERLRREVADRD